MPIVVVDHLIAAPEALAKICTFIARAIGMAEIVVAAGVR
jgi:hypothetical protein